MATFVCVGRGLRPGVQGFGRHDVRGVALTVRTDTTTASVAVVQAHRVRSRRPRSARYRLWTALACAVATLATAGFMLNGNIRYQVGVGRVSGFSIAETFSHRPIAFRLLSAGQAWFPELVSTLGGPPGSWGRVWVFETGFRLIAAGMAAAAAALLWTGLRQRWGPQAWPYAIAAYAALVFTAPATGEPDWMAALLAVAAVGAGLAWRPRIGAVAGGVLLAVVALVKISTLPVALAALVIIWAFDRRRAWVAGATALVAGLLAVGLMWWLAPYEIAWLLDIRALQPDPWTPDSAVEAGHYLMNLAARWPVVALIPAFFVGARRDEKLTAAAALALTCVTVVAQGQYYIYHSAGLVALSALLAVRTVQRSRAALRWPLLGLTGWTLVLFLLPAAWRIDNLTRLYLLTGAAAVALAVWQQVALRRPPTARLPAHRAAGWPAILVLVAMLATQTPYSSESLTLSTTAARTSATSSDTLRKELADAESIHALIGVDTPVAYLVFGASTYAIGNPTHCRFPSALFLQRPGAREKVSPATRQENLACLSQPDAQWLVWDRDWLRRRTAPDDLRTAIDQHWDCDAATLIGGYTLCPRRA